MYAAPCMCCHTHARAHARHDQAHSAAVATCCRAAMHRCVQVRCNTTREELEEMLLSSGVLDAMMAPVEQVLQRAAAAGTTVHALELCVAHHIQTHPLACRWSCV
jgi:hypothetical protein